jgi:hypothetical protein
MSRGITGIMSPHHITSINKVMKIKPTAAFLGFAILVLKLWFKNERPGGAENSL